MIDEKRLLEIVEKLTASPNLRHPEATVAFCILALKPKRELEPLELHAYRHLVQFMALVAWDCPEDCGYANE